MVSDREKDNPTLQGSITVEAESEAACNDLVAGILTGMDALKVQTARGESYVVNRGGTDQYGDHYQHNFRPQTVDPITTIMVFTQEG
jgi:hypothetical protein